jgi:hypothetical protein
MAAAFLALALLACLAACSDDDGTPVPADTSSPSASVPAATASSTPERSPTATSEPAPSATAQAAPSAVCGQLGPGAKTTIWEARDPFCIGWEDGPSAALGYRVHLYYRPSDEHVYDAGPQERAVFPPQEDWPWGCEQGYGRRSMTVTLYRLTADGPQMADGFASQGECIGTPPAPNTEPCPVDEGACEFAAQVEGLLVARDWPALAALFAPTTVTCLGDLSDPLNVGYFVCPGKQPGETAEGYHFGHLHSEGGIVPAGDLLPQLERTLQVDSALWDPAGYGDFRLYTLGEGSPPFQPQAACAPCYTLVYSGIVGKDVASYVFRGLFLFVVGPDDAGWRIHLLASGSTHPPGMAAALKGGELFEVPVSPWSPGGQTVSDLPFWLDGVARVEGTLACLPLYREPGAPAGQEVPCLPDATEVHVIEGLVSTPQGSGWLVQTFPDQGVRGVANGAFLGAW